MAGRRIREALRAKLIPAAGIPGQDEYVVIAGPGNTYAHYVATREEYAVQRYEGASTIYGQCESLKELTDLGTKKLYVVTLDAYVDKYSSLVPFLADNISAVPTKFRSCSARESFKSYNVAGVVFDAAPLGKKFGQVLQDVNSTPYEVGDMVSALFVGANPRNNLRLESTVFLTIDYMVNGVWKTVRSDSHPSTFFRWTRRNTVLGTSTVEISWTIESGTPEVTSEISACRIPSNCFPYRISYFGDYKPIIGSITAFSGASSSFTVSSLHASKSELQTSDLL